MYLQKLSITNFRKYGGSDDSPGVSVSFNKGLNVLIGENESGKSTIVDAIRFVLQTQSYDYTRLEDADFHCDEERADSLRIECEFKGFTNKEAGNFLEWIGFDKNNEYVLNVWLYAQRKDNRILQEIRAGMDDIGTQLDAGARDLLRITYLKPLRDAEMEMSSGRRSRFAQLLKNHSSFKCTKEEEKNHPLTQIVTKADNSIRYYFNSDDTTFSSTNDSIQASLDALIHDLEKNDEEATRKIKDKLIGLREKLTTDSSTDGQQIISQINEVLNLFTSETTKQNPFVSLSGVELWAILQRLTLNIDKNQPSLGLLNLLYIAAELMLLKKEGYSGLKMAIIEELEAHLHPHYQINTLSYFAENIDKIGQVILTTHSVVLGSSVSLSDMIICNGDKVFPMGKDEEENQFTNIGTESALFLERFLDATKANLFFAKGVIIVEGDAENLLIPAIAEAIDLPLNKYGVSIVNVGSTAWKRYVQIFERKSGPQMPMKVAVISDGDVPCIDHFIANKPKVYFKMKPDGQILIETDKKRFEQLLTDNQILDEQPVRREIEEDHLGEYHDFLKKKITPYASPNTNIRVFSNEWTLEYSIAKSDLKEHMLNAMKLAKETSDASTSLPKDTSDPYKLMKPFLGNLSKALTAQFLAKYIIDNKNNLKDLLENDPELVYLSSAIRFACGKESRD